MPACARQYQVPSSKPAYAYTYSISTVKLHGFKCNLLQLCIDCFVPVNVRATYGRSCHVETFVTKTSVTSLISAQATAAPCTSQCYCHALSVILHNLQVALHHLSIDKSWAAQFLNASNRADCHIYWQVMKCCLCSAICKFGKIGAYALTT